MTKDVTIRKQLAQLRLQRARKVKAPTTVKLHMHNQKSSTTSHMACDFSGSMSGVKEGYLKDAIRELHPQFPSVQLVGFAAGEVDYFSFEDLDYLTTTGGTPMLKCLRFIWQEGATGILLITDGYPDDNEQQILGEAMEYRHVPISPIGIGDGHRDFNERFLQELARITGGQYKNVKEGDLHLLAPTMQQLLIGTDHGKKSGGSGGTIHL